MQSRTNGEKSVTAEIFILMNHKLQIVLFSHRPAVLNIKFVGHLHAVARFTCFFNRRTQHLVKLKQIYNYYLNISMKARKTKLNRTKPNRKTRIEFLRVKQKHSPKAFTRKKENKNQPYKIVPTNSLYKIERRKNWKKKNFKKQIWVVVKYIEKNVNSNANLHSFL